MKPFSKHPAFPLLPFLLAIGGLYWIYSLAQGLTWQFDDFINLKGLKDVSSAAGLADFVFGGVAGPLGRPLSLITFVANYADWPQNPWGVVRLTLILHAINGALVFLLARRILFSRAPLASDETRANRLAVWTAVLWLLLPIHASGVLMPVQRMTHVSAFFTLLALYGYMVLRQRQDGVPTVWGMVALNAWVGVAALASVFAKENGAVTVTFVVLLEMFCFYPAWKGHGMGVRGLLWRLWLVLAGSMVVAAMAWHVLTGWDGIRSSFDLYRGYRWSEHIATQWVISLEYLRQIVMPRSALLGPFHDNHAVYSWNMAAPYAAMLIWLGLFLSALLLARRTGSTPAARTLGWAGCAAVLWFFAGHQIESTVIPLELYFEHRNYLASLGICFWLVMVFDRFVDTAQRKLVPYALALLYLAYLVFSLQQITSLWGQPILAHDLWQKNHPNSTRAAQSVIQDLMELGFQDAAFSFADDFIEKQNAIDVAIQMMPLRCKHHPAAEQAQSFARLQQQAQTIRTPGGITTGLANFGRAVRDGSCAGLDAAQYEGFLQQLLATPQIQHAVKVRHHVYYELALMAKQRQDMDGYIDNLKRAYEDFPAISIAQLVATTLFQEQRIDEAIEWIDSVVEHAPNASLRAAWRATLQSMRDALIQIQQSLQENRRPHEPATPGNQ